MGVRRVGVLIFVLGLAMLGVFTIPALMTESRAGRAPRRLSSARR
jgi:hypothetical protein